MQLLMKNLNIIFDLDGTLVHSAPDLHAAANVALTQVGRPTLDLALVTSFIGNGVEKLMERCVSHTGDAPVSVHSAALRVFLLFQLFLMFQGRPPLLPPSLPLGPQ